MQILVVALPLLKGLRIEWGCTTPCATAPEQFWVRPLLPLHDFQHSRVGESCDDTRFCPTVTKGIPIFSVKLREAPQRVRYSVGGLLHDDVAERSTSWTPVTAAWSYVLQQLVWTSCYSSCSLPAAARAGFLLGTMQCRTPRDCEVIDAPMQSCLECGTLAANNSC